MNIEDLTIKEIKEINELIAGKVQSSTSTSFRTGQSYLIRTVTMMYTGKLMRITDTDLILDDAAWIADSGRYSNALKEGTLNEVEPYPNAVIVSRAAIVDAAIWSHPLPREQK